MVTVRVPATTANIGPGFDTFGCAFKLYNTFRIEEQPSGLSFDGFESVFCNEGNLVVVGYRAVMNALHLPMPGLYVAITENEIPICRGLGSSSSLIVAGAVAANAIHGNPLSRLRRQLPLLRGAFCLPRAGTTSSAVRSFPSVPPKLPPGRPRRQ